MESIQIEGYKVTEKIGTGGTAKVYKAIKENGEKVAIKVLKKDNPLTQREIDILSSINSNNILKIISFGETSFNDNPNFSFKKYIILQLAEKGDLFDYIGYTSKPFKEKTARLILKKIALGLKDIHDSGIAHRDLKVDNILLDDQYEPKISDFGFAIKVPQDGSKLKTFVGTISYAAPEIIMKTPYNGVLADIFSLGVILFILVVGRQPFKFAAKKDKFYRYIAYEQFELYWNFYKKFCSHLSPEVKELFEHLIAFDPSKRPQNINEVLNFKFFNQEYPTEEEYKNEMKERENIIRQNAAEKQKDLMEEEIPQDDRVYRDGEDCEEYFEDDTTCNIYKGLTLRHNDIEIKLGNPKDFMNQICLKIRENKEFDKDISTRQNKFTFFVEAKRELDDDLQTTKEETEDEEDDTEVEENPATVKVTLKQKKDSDNIYVLSIYHVNGNIFDFNKIRNEIIKAI